MKQVCKLVCTLSFLITLGGCLASTTSPVGINCDYSQGKPFWELPVDCQGGR